MGHDLTVNISGTVKYQDLYGDTKGTVTTKSFTEKQVYELITNAVGQAASDSTPEGAIPSVALPSDGYIAFNPQGYDGEVDGTFYVTNKSGYYYPLSGFDTNDDYYSFIELDTTIYYDSSTNGPEDQAFNFGFYDFDDDLFFGVASYNISKSNSGSDTSTSKALLYVHDFPYDYGDPTGNDLNNGEPGNDFYPFDDENGNALEIGGVLTTQLDIKDSNIDGGSLSLTGSGNFALDDFDYYGVLTSGSAKIH